MSTSSLEHFSVKAGLFLPEVGRHVRTHWAAWALLVALGSITQANYRLCLNMSPSLPNTLFVIKLNDRIVQGGYVAYAWHGGGPYPAGMTFVKRVLAGPGDNVTRRGRDYVAGGRTLVGKARGMTGRALFPNEALKEGLNILPPSRYFVAGDHEYSLDSRYSLAGLVHEDEVIGRAYPIF